jgi:coatomer subunit beta'
LLKLTTPFFFFADLKKLAMDVSTDPDHQFDLAIQLGDLDRARSLAAASSAGPPSEPKWRAIGDRALETWRIDLAQECFTKANDLSALLLIYTSTGDSEGLAKLAELAGQKGANNVAFAANLTLGRRGECVEVLLESGREAEAAMFARTFKPSMVPKALDAWKASNSKVGGAGKKTAAVAGKKASVEGGEEKKGDGGLADPRERPEAFLEGWEAALKREKEEEEKEVQGGGEGRLSPPSHANGIEKEC